MPFFSFDPYNFFIGFLTATIFWWLVGKARPLWNDVKQGLREQSNAAQVLRSSTVEENHRRLTLRRAQGMHLAAPLFALNDILLEPLLMAPPPSVEPGRLPTPDDLVTQTLP
ncbi:MAG: hypothetical protein A2Z03_01495 [Chloroflexi bacterium RBG_16_56_8]|nr:MAG: hypothetical protein A2Z03_01495 [Chloroflexi bacterium RBG_16_56_8]